MPRHPRFGGRTLARSQALQLLFQAEATGRMVVDVLAGEYALSDGPLDPYAEELACGADAMVHELDAVLGMAANNWGVSRMPAVDRNLLRLATYEMLEVGEVDTAVSIDECVELAKAYGTDESARFVNGVLGRVASLMAEGQDVVALAVGAEGTAGDGADAGDAGEADDAAPGQVGDGEAEASADDVAEGAAESVPEPESEPEDGAPANDELPAWAREA